MASASGARATLPRKLKPRSSMRHDRLLPRADKVAAAKPEGAGSEDIMPIEERVFIAGAGPVGLMAAANLVRRGVPVTVFEAGAVLAEESRASTFHPPTP